MDAKQNTEKGKVCIDKTLKIEKSMRSQKVIIGLGIGILICALILILRWTS